MWKSIDQARSEYNKHINELTDKVAVVIEDTRGFITIQEIQSKLSTAGAAANVGRALLVMN